MGRVKCIILIRNTKEKEDFENAENINDLTNKVGDFYDPIDVDRDCIYRDSPKFLEELKEVYGSINSDISCNENIANKAKERNDKHSEYLYNYYKYASLAGIPHYGSSCITDDTYGEYRPEEIKDMIDRPEMLKKFTGMLVLSIHC